jgi:opacity protein-like surface antigen
VTGKLASRRLERTCLALTVAVLACAAPAAQALDLIGPYIGAAIGQGRVETGELTVSTSGNTASAGTFAENHSAYKLLAGVRPISLIGVEVEYLDFGRPGRSFSSGVIARADVKLDGAAAFGVLYLLPVPLLDVYVKAGVARLQATANLTGILPGVGICPVGSPNCAVFSQRNTVTNTGAAAGAGVQLKVGAWAVHAEYERFSAAGGNPGLASVGVRWTFL